MGSRLRWRPTLRWLSEGALAAIPLPLPGRGPRVSGTRALSPPGVHLRRGAFCWRPRGGNGNGFGPETVSGLDGGVPGDKSQLYDRSKQPHRLPKSSAVTMVFHPATHFTTEIQVRKMVKSLKPVMESLALGHYVLVFCINGQNRSGQTGTFIVASCTGKWEEATAHAWLRRRLVDYSSLPGRRGAKCGLRDWAPAGFPERTRARAYVRTYEHMDACVRTPGRTYIRSYVHTINVFEVVFSPSGSSTAERDRSGPAVLVW